MSSLLGTRSISPLLLVPMQCMQTVVYPKSQYEDGEKVGELRAKNDFEAGLLS